MGCARWLAIPAAWVAAIAAVAAAGPPLPHDIERPAAYLADVDGSVVASHAIVERRQPASLAKLAGALVALRQSRSQPGLLDSHVAVSARAAAARGTRLGLAAGDRARAGDLLAAMLVGSANDACLALAEHLAGSGIAFVERMNALAAGLRMRDTRFADPCGFDDPAQYTTAADMLLLARAAIADQSLLRIVRSARARVLLVGDARALELANTNHLLHAYSGAFGLKTGYTRRAGRCIIAAARRGSSVAIVVILGGKDRWSASVALLDHALDRVSPVPRIQDPAVIGAPDR